MDEDKKVDDLAVSIAREFLVWWEFTLTSVAHVAAGLVEEAQAKAKAKAEAEVKSDG